MMEKYHLKTMVKIAENHGKIMVFYEYPQWISDELVILGAPGGLRLECGLRLLASASGCRGPSGGVGGTEGARRGAWAETMGEPTSGILHDFRCLSITLYDFMGCIGIMEVNMFFFCGLIGFYRFSDV
jgi:hypothetical protein